jgi:hypothetical protein
VIGKHPGGHFYRKVGLKTNFTRPALAQFLLVAQISPCIKSAWLDFKHPEREKRESYAKVAKNTKKEIVQPLFILASFLFCVFRVTFALFAFRKFSFTE